MAKRTKESGEFNDEASEKIYDTVSVYLLCILSMGYLLELYSLTPSNNSLPAIPAAAFHRSKLVLILSTLDQTFYATKFYRL
jgi:hypothetical protein